MKYFSLAILIAVLVAGAMALNDYAVGYDAHQAVDRLADRYNVCYNCKLPSTISGGDDINAIFRTGVRNICNMTPAQLHHNIDLYTK